MKIEPITSEQVEDFIKNDQLSEIIEILKDIANGDYSVDAFKQDILENLEN